MKCPNLTVADLNVSVWLYLKSVGATQAQFDLLQSFSKVIQSSKSVEPEAASTWAALSCGYCSKSFKTSGGLNRHVSLVRMQCVL